MSNRVLPSMSVKRKVTVPSGRSTTISVSAASISSRRRAACLCVTHAVQEQGAAPQVRAAARRREDHRRAVRRVEPQHRAQGAAGAAAQEGREDEGEAGGAEVRAQAGPAYGEAKAIAITVGA